MVNLWRKYSIVLYRIDLILLLVLARRPGKMVGPDIIPVENHCIVLLHQRGNPKPSTFLKPVGSVREMFLANFLLASIG